MMKHFIAFELGKIVKYFKTKKIAKIITALLFIGVFTVIALGIYSFFVSGFRFINVEAVEDIRLALTLFLYELFLIVLGAIIIFSSMVSGIFSLFRGTTNAWVLGSPSYTILPKVVLIRSMLNSLLPCVIMFIPAVLAFNHVNKLGLISAFFILVSVVLFMLTLVTLTLLAVLLVAKVYYHLTKIFTGVRFSFGRLVVLLLGIVTVAVVLLWKAIRSVDLVKLFRAENVDSNLSLMNISSHFSFLPTHPFAMEILYWQNNNTSNALFYFSILLVLTLALVVVWWKISYLFYPLWQKFQEGTAQGDSNKYLLKNTTTYEFTGNATMVLFKKEALISSRNFKGVLWFAFLLFIWVMQIAANKILGHNVRLYQPDISARTIMLQVIQFIIAVYFMCSFVLRFVFPSFSVEKKTAWILASAPLSFGRIFFSKYLFYSTFFVSLGLIMSTISVNVLNLSTDHTIHFISLLISVIIFIVTLGLSLGALFPSYETDDPEAVTTSMPGLFFTALALLYGALSGYVLYLSLIQVNTSLLYFYTVATLLVSIVMLISTPYFVKIRAREKSF